MAEDGSDRRESWIDRFHDIIEQHTSIRTRDFPTYLADAPHAASAISAATSAVSDATSAASDAVFAAASSSLELIDDAKEKLEWVKAQYEFHEDMAFSKIKEGVIVAASHPGLSSAVAAGVGLVVLKGPRNFFIQNVRRLFVSKETLLSNAQTEVVGLRQSVNLVNNEARKLTERALNAEKEFQKGRADLIREGRAIEKELRTVRKIEKQAMGLKVILGELPKTQAASLRTEAASLVSGVKKEKEALNGALSKIINHGVPI
ncbi:RGS1-HXK1-interacting protein 1 [Typha angustifolia]|uniref:RGS1-HXK1-interacting protein 1 n=1 Tax=Typha angustifolia TaxID=59011 RepID=UPI003C2F27AD